jgi:hypothetical protein
LDRSPRFKTDIVPYIGIGFLRIPEPLGKYLDRFAIRTDEPGVINGMVCSDILEVKTPAGGLFTHNKTGAVDHSDHEYKYY